MKAASIYEINKQLKELGSQQIVELCMSLAKYKKENKELLSYLLFDSNDEKRYIQNIKEELEELFWNMNTNTTYLIKKSLRKILRMLNKYIKYSGNKQTELELRIYFCKKIKTARIPINTSTLLSNIYNQQKEKIKIILSKLHEDLQYDYQQEIEHL